MVEVGGDVAVRGCGPDGPWAIGVADSLVVDRARAAHRASRAASPRRSIARANLARGARVANHVVDPRTGWCADGPYATATVTAAELRDAPTRSPPPRCCGARTPRYHIAQAGWSARLVTPRRRR